MKTDLFYENTPQQFWGVTSSSSDDLWQDAIDNNIDLLDLSSPPTDTHDLISYILGEEQYGKDVWKLSDSKRLYYLLKPILPRAVTIIMRRLYHSSSGNARWFIDEHYAKFLTGVLEYVIVNSSDSLNFKALWPNQKRYAFLLTHDIEDADGQKVVPELADIVERHGFRSAFFFVPERYSLDYGLIGELKARGFEIGIHGLKHDGKLFFSQHIFEERVKKINAYAEKLGAVGFASPLTHRHGVWMQKLNIEYDRSFFDIDLFEPMPGGVMSIWPYHIGKFIELPYTMLQDYTLSQVMKETTPALWIEKLQFIRQYRGMALLNSHPDYLKYENTKRVYIEFLNQMQDMDDYWHALPHEAAAWWRYRHNAQPGEENIDLTTYDSTMIRV